MGGPSETTQTTQTVLSPEQRQMLNLAMPWLTQFAQNPPQLPTQSGVVGFNPLQERAQSMALNQIPWLQNFGRSVGRGNEFLASGRALSPDSNPALAAYIEAATRPIQQNLTESTLPNLRGEAVNAGQFGSSRQGIAEGLASGRASEAIGGTGANIANQGYQSGLDAMTRAIGLAPQTAGLQMMPTQVASGVGDVRHAYDQAVRNEELQRWQWEQMLPLMMGQQFAGLAAGLPGGGTTTTASGPMQSPWATALGGLSLGSALFPGMFSSMGSGLSSLLPMMFMS